MRLKLQAGNAKQGLWEEEIPFARPAGILEEHGHAFKHTSPSAGLKKKKKEIHISKLNTCSQQFLRV